LHGELELLVRAGFSLSDALAAATSVPATTFHLNDRGRIAPGLRADLLLVRGNPTQDIKATRDIIAVWKVGVEDDRTLYRAGLAN
jgi:imidazolonepropionase-like amidohydrolase